MVNFLDDSDADKRATDLGDKIPDERTWQDAATFIYGSITQAFYDVARARNYSANDCREFLALNMLYHVCNLAVESGITREQFTVICGDGYDAAIEIADECFETAGNA